MIESLMSSDLPLGFSVSATTRAPRGEEVDGVSYHFITPEHLRKKYRLESLLNMKRCMKGFLTGPFVAKLRRCGQKAWYLFLILML